MSILAGGILGGVEAVVIFGGGGGRGPMKEKLEFQGPLTFV